jgi:hypothetical protein
MTASSACVVDLPLLRRACGPLIGCYERFLSEGSVDLHDLDHALASLRVLPPLEGRLGRAVALVTSGGAGAPTEQTLAALELLRTTTGLRPAPKVALSPAPTGNRSSREAGPTQLCLPDMD